MTPAPLAPAELAVARRALAYALGRGWGGLTDPKAGAAGRFFAAPPPGAVPAAHARFALTAIEHCRNVLRDDPAIGHLLGDEADITPAAYKLRALVRAAGLPPGEGRVLTGRERSITISGLAYLRSGSDYAKSGMTIPEAEAKASLDYFHCVDRNAPLGSLVVEHALNGAMAFECCCVVLNNDFELGALVGYEPDLTGTMLKLDAAGRLRRG